MYVDRYSRILSNEKRFFEFSYANYRFDIIKAISIEQLRFYVEVNLNRDWKIEGPIQQIKQASGKRIFIIPMSYKVF